MTTRMENVAEDVALTALRKATRESEFPLDPEKLKETLRASWPAKGSQQPMNHALKAAAKAASQEEDSTNSEEWSDLLEKAWAQAVEDAVQEYFESARQSFKQGATLEALETLTDAVRATFGHIAATHQWPHATNSDIYFISGALGSNGRWPHTLEDLDQALLNASKEGKEMGLAMAASMGRPKMYSFGSYEGDNDTAEKEGLLFASTAIEMANLLAQRTAT